jgi:glucose/mannose-6-phosphate isomerase
MYNLDCPTTYSSLDSTGLRDRLRDLPRQCEIGWRLGRTFTLPEKREFPDKVVICGMGGSAIAGDLLADLVSIQPTVPIFVVRDFRLPFLLDRRSLVIVCSYSGNTEETLSMFHQALRAGAQLMAVTGGGLLADEAGARKVPLLTIDLSGEPRSAVGYTLLLLLGILGVLGLVETTEEDVRAATRALRQQVSQFAEEVPTGDNLAKQLALALTDKVILIYGAGIFSGMARRWKTQFNENAKAWAFFETMPELLHNSVEAYGSSPKISQHVMALLLHPNTVDDQVSNRYHIVAQLLRHSGLSLRVLEGQKGQPLGQMLAMLLLGDYVSYYLAMLNEVDPSPTPAIVLVKQRLSERSPDASAEP